ncbi:glycosyltransferase family 2 protein [Parabacteroides distasonis]|uniref:glycosyltransferase family 2 protein n=1 Tax=Parabacteroides distasonis TaxID=823 RepID=UPI00189B66E9|nr:glycosyltransferase family 2 protein [Parabacteroides distasonis]MDB9192592.1 glycosyltransferase family 2 protein [Parabacteroides distasonis]MDB9201579.1 glycosyltransferase family 2 protein [Parabacteroides distasonis]
MKISVIIPTYKPQSYLWECLDAIRVQTFQEEDFEVLLILNGCSEPYRSQIEYFLKDRNMRNVCLIQTDQPGVSNARNIGLDCAKGDYIAFIDDDDYVSPSYLKELYEKASPDTISLCYPYAFNDGCPDVQLPYYITEAYKYCSRKKGKLTLPSKVRKYFSGPWMKLIPMNFIQGRRFDVHFKNGEDSLFMFLISDRFKDFSITSSQAVYYRRYRQMSATTSRRAFRERLQNGCRYIISLSQIYFKEISRYNGLFYLSRVIGGVFNLFNG